MLITKNVGMVWNHATKKIYGELGYSCDNFGDIFYVNVNDLSKNSHIIIRAKCDYCGNEFDCKYQSYNRGRETVEKDCCENCRALKIQDVMMKRYNVKSSMQIDEVKQKVLNTNKEKYGVEHPQTLPETKEKARKTNIERYGVENITQLPEYQEAIKKTNLQKYGCERPTQNEEIKQKVRNTLIEHYGVDNPTKNPEIIHKSVMSRYKHGNFTCSKQQYHIYELIGGELNFPFMNYVIDIAFPNEKIAVEYSGKGHNLSVVLGKISQEEFNRNENFRKIQLFNDDWKIIEFVSKTDKLPTDENVDIMFQYCMYKLEHGCHYISVDLDDYSIYIHKNKQKIISLR